MQQLYIIKQTINIAIRATYYIFCCRNRNWDSPDFMQFWLLLFSFFVFCFFLFCFFFVLFFNNPISSSICKLPILSEIYNCTFKNTNKVPLLSSSSSSLLLLLLLLLLLSSSLLLLLFFTRQSLQIKKMSFQIPCKAFQYPPRPFPQNCGLFSTKSFYSACLAFGKGKNLLSKPNISSISFTIYVHVP